LASGSEGERQVLGLDVGPSEDRAFWTAFLRSLVKRGLRGVRLIVSDAHEGLKQAIAKVADGLRSRFAKAAALLEDAAEDILAYRNVPVEHQRQLHSTNPLERLNKEIKRRSNVVGIFPTSRSVLRLVGTILMEQDDEWTVAERRYFSAESMKQLSSPELPATHKRFSPRLPE
jgi:putative transposase